MNVHFVDTTFRDGSQSLWASGMRTGMMEAVAGIVGRAGFDVVEVPVTGLFLKHFVRNLKEDPWEMIKMLAREMPDTVKSCHGGASIHPFEPPPPRAIIEMFFSHLVKLGGLNRLTMTSNTVGQIDDAFPWSIPMFKKLGLQVVLAISYTISPRHTNEYYAEITRKLVNFKPDRIYLKDQGGLLTVDRLRTLLPVILENAGNVPVELHSHCTTGLAPLVYFEALQLGIRILHTAIPPLANGSSQPSIFNINRNSKFLGFDSQIDEAVVAEVSQRLSRIAHQEGLPVGIPLEYDYAQYIHQVPGGVISHLRRQLRELGIEDRLEDVLEECAEVRKDFGYPIMITPHSQFIVTQAAINIALGERYKNVIDELILFAQGSYGDDSGHLWMDQNFRDRLIGTERAKKLSERHKKEIPVSKIREKLNATDVSDEEFLLRYIMKGEEEIAEMRNSGKTREYLGTRQPLIDLIKKFEKIHKVSFVHIQNLQQSLILQK